MADLEPPTPPVVSQGQPVSDPIQRAHSNGGFDKSMFSEDLHLGNILLQLPPRLGQLSEEQLYREFGAPDPEPILRAGRKPLPPGVPTHVFSPIWLGTASQNIPLSEAGILLTDFGVSFSPAQESRLKSYTPLEIRPPEARFEPTTPLSYASDIWSLACTMWAILDQRSLLDNFLFIPDDATGDQVDALGPLPSEWWNKWEGRLERFTEDGQPREGRSPWTWDQRFEDSI